MDTRFTRGFCLALDNIAKAIPAGGRDLKPVRYVNGEPVFRFRVEAIRCGNYLTADGEPFEVTPAALTAWGDYHEAQGEEIVAIKSGNSQTKGRRWHRKPEEDVIAVQCAHEGIIDPKLFERVQRKLRHTASPRPTAPQRAFPLTDLIFCGHCKNKMIGETGRGRNREGKQAYLYLRYVCSHYSKFGTDGQHNTTCGHHAVDADNVLNWLVKALQDVYLGPGRDVLVQDITHWLKQEAKAGGSDVDRLEKKTGAKTVKAVGQMRSVERTQTMTT